MQWSKVTAGFTEVKAPPRVSTRAESAGAWCMLIGLVLWQRNGVSPGAGFGYSPRRYSRSMAVIF
jgi:hypothetical protein